MKWGGLLLGNTAVPALKWAKQYFQYQSYRSMRDGRSPAKLPSPRGVRAPYWHQSTQPLVSLIFVGPMLIIYEVGLLVMGPAAMRNGAEVWLRHFLNFAGFGQYFLLPLLTCATLLGWHHLTHQQWRVYPAVLVAMLLESTALSLFLLGIAQIQGVLFLFAADRLSAVVSLYASVSSAQQLVGFFGAGIYEELLFRLILIPAIAGGLQWLGEPRRASYLTAIFTSSLVFSVAHFRVVTPMGDPFDWFSFLFRFIAGIFFSVLFYFRGFGIAAGAHTVYDVIVGVAFGMD